MPQGVYPEVGARIMDLQEPTKKMSTTGGTPQGTVLVLDEPDVIRKKFKTAVTDSGREVRYAPDEKPGVSNLIEILSVATATPIPDVEASYDGRGYGAGSIGIPYLRCSPGAPAASFSASPGSRVSTIIVSFHVSCSP